MCQQESDFIEVNHSLSGGELGELGHTGQKKYDKLRRGCGELVKVRDGKSMSGTE